MLAMMKTKVQENDKSMATNTIVEFMLEKFCCCFTPPKEGSDDDNVNVQTTLLCCVKTRELHIIDVKDHEPNLAAVVAEEEYVNEEKCI